MPSFDVVSEVDKHELTNAVDQANRELDTRFDFKGSRPGSSWKTARRSTSPRPAISVSSR